MIIYVCHKVWVVFVSPIDRLENQDSVVTTQAPSKAKTPIWVSVPQGLCFLQHATAAAGSSLLTTAVD